jgi:hypothetical protein
MPYKRPMSGSKKYISPFYNTYPSHPLNSIGVPLYKDKDFLGIPLPNEVEAFPDYAAKKNIPRNPLSGIIRYIQKNIKIEELILIGLIILLLDESFEDDLLLIVLIYILLF